MAHQSFRIPRCGRGLPRSEICEQEISLLANRVEKWGSGQCNRMTRDRIHRLVQRANADSEKHLERREEAWRDFRLSSRQSRYIDEGGEFDVGRMGHWCDLRGLVDAERTIWTHKTGVLYSLSLSTPTPLYHVSPQPPQRLDTD